MGMFRARINLQLLHLGTGKAVAWKHSLYRMLDDKFRTAITEFLDTHILLIPEVTAVEHVFLLVFLPACDNDLFRIDHDNEIPRVHVGSVRRAMAPSKNVCNFNRKTPEDLALRVNDVPLGLNFTLFRQIAFHYSKKERTVDPPPHLST